jgi:hypothetical protein
MAQDWASGRIRWTTALLIAAALAFAAPAAAAPGDLLYARTLPELKGDGDQAVPTGGALRPDGKLLVVGYFYAEDNFEDADVFVALVDPATGALDPGFGSGGIVRHGIELEMGGDDMAFDIALHADGRIVTVGEARVGVNTQAFVLVLEPDGTPDADFGGGDGVVTVDAAPFSADRANDVVVVGDVITFGGLSAPSPPGVLLARFDMTGQPVNAFDDDGQAVIPLGGSGFDEIAEVVDDGGGGIAFAATVELGPNADLALGRVGPDGRIPTGGLNVITGPNPDQAVSLLKSGDRYVVGSNDLDTAHVDFYDAALQAVGAPRTPFGAGPSRMDDTAKVDGDELLVLGVGPPASGATSDDLALAQLATDGALTGFTAGGHRSYPGSSADERAAALVAGGGRAVAIGQQIGPPAGSVPLVVGVELGQGGSQPPPAPVSSADLAVTKTYQGRGDEAQAHVDTFDGGNNYGLIFEVTNHGPDNAFGVTLVDDLPDGMEGFQAVAVRRFPSGSVVTRIPCTFERTRTPRQTEFGAGRMTCDLGALIPGESVRLVLRVRAQRAGFFPNAASVSSGTPDPIPANNTDRAGLTVYSLDSVITIGSARACARAAPCTVTGRTRQRAAGAQANRAAVARVDVALLRTTGGAVATAARPRCRWLASARGRFRDVKPTRRRCDKPVWRRAKGTARWSFKLRKGLPKGRYVLYSRATNRAGVSESRFRAADRNRLAFRVR